MLQSDKVESSEDGKIRLRDAYKEANLTIETLAEEARVSSDTVKRLLGTKACPNGVERWTVTNIAKVLNLKPTDIVDSREWNPQQLPPEFEPLIKEKIRTFCGREFIFNTFNEFINTYPKGYFTVIGDAGMGKSAIAAKYVSDYQSPCYFNILAERRNRPELFLKSIRQQLINRYELRDAGDADLAMLLAKVAQKLPSWERLVIVVDALDEVDQEAGDNLLYLPINLPDGIYFLLTRRPYNLGKKRLTVSPGVPVQELDLRANEYVEFSREDVKAYIRLCLNDEYYTDLSPNPSPARRGESYSPLTLQGRGVGGVRSNFSEESHKNGLKTWISYRNITPEAFIEQVTVKSENNFMYLRYVLPGISRGDYNDLSLKELPDGLQDYYQTHWVRMGMETTPKELMAIILFILVEIGTAIPCEMIAGITGEDDYEVQSILDAWVEYLRGQEIEEEFCYSFYHGSFLDFLKGKRELQSTRRLFRDVNQRIVDYFRTVK